VLILMIVSVLVLGAATLVLQAAQQTRRPLEEQRTTEQRMKRIEQAITAYWFTNGCVTLPSTPAGLPSDPAPEVPWVALGLQADDRLDAWGRLITYRQGASELTVSGTAARWALVSHGPSGLGAWLPSGVQKLPLPVVTNTDETANLKATTPFELIQKPAFAPSHTDPATATDHFDDVVFSGVLPACGGTTVPPGTPSVIFNADALGTSGVTFNGFASGTTTLTIPSTSTTPGLTLTVGQAGHEISFDNTQGTKSGVGVCSTNNGNANSSELGGTETLSFKLLNATALRIGLLFENFSLVESAQITFKLNGVQVGAVLAYSGASNASNLAPANPLVAFDEVVVGAGASSSFFIEALRFCDANTSCVP
jgi:hypothetical protein